MSEPRAFDFDPRQSTAPHKLFHPEIANTLTYGGVEASQSPLDIYSRWFRDFLIFVVPIGCITYVTILRLLGHRELHAPGWLLDAAPLCGIIFLLVAICIWRLRARHYTSTGT